MGRLWIGADPGGIDKFGLAFLDDSSQLRCVTVSSVDEAVKSIHASGEPSGIGIDAPLWWSAARGGGRLADERIRKRYRIKSGTVQSANSLRGAALAGGALLASLVRREFPNIGITESHPKALLRALDPKDDGASFARRFKIPTDWRNEHERDAAIAAVCAREGFEGRWQMDLAEQRNGLEQDPKSYWLAPVSYFWPEDV